MWEEKFDICDSFVGTYGGFLLISDSVLRDWTHDRSLIQITGVFGRIIVVIAPK